MTHYLSFVAFAAVIAVAPGPDTLLTLRSTLGGGRSRGLWTMIGITGAGSVQGLLAATGLGAIIVRAEPAFEAIRWAGVAYLAYLGVQAVRAALRPGSGTRAEAGTEAVTSPMRALGQGFLCNITNPKVLAFNLAVLPQFLGTEVGTEAGPGAPWATLVGYALTLAAVGAFVLLAVVLAADAARHALASRRARRGIDAASGVTFLGFATLLAAEA